MDHQERDICMETMLPTISTLSMVNNNGVDDNDDNLFAGILGISGTSGVKRPLASASAFCSETATGSPSGSSSSSKRFHGDLNGGGGGGGGGMSCTTNSADENSSFISLLSQLPTQHHQNNTTPFLGSLGDGVLRQQFQLPSLNWTS